MFLQTVYKTNLAEISDLLESAYFVWALTVSVYESEQSFSLAENLCTAFSNIFP